MDNFLLYWIWQCWGRGNETGERAWYRVSDSCLFGFSTLTPRSNFTVQNRGCMMARCSPLNQWTWLDPGPLTEPVAHRYRLNTPTPACAWLIWLLLSLSCVPMEPRHVGFASQVLVPLTSLNVHMEADVRSVWAAPILVCDNLELFSNTDDSRLVLFIWLIEMATPGLEIFGSDYYTHLWVTVMLIGYFYYLFFSLNFFLCLVI